MKENLDNYKLELKINNSQYRFLYYTFRIFILVYNDKSFIRYSAMYLGFNNILRLLLFKFNFECES